DQPARAGHVDELGVHTARGRAVQQLDHVGGAGAVVHRVDGGLDDVIIGGAIAGEGARGCCPRRGGPGGRGRGGRDCDGGSSGGRGGGGGGCGGGGGAGHGRVGGGDGSEGGERRRCLADGAGFHSRSSQWSVLRRQAGRRPTTRSKKAAKSSRYTASR